MQASDAVSAVNKSQLYPYFLTSPLLATHWDTSLPLPLLFPFPKVIMKIAGGTYQAGTWYYTLMGPPEVCQSPQKTQRTSISEDSVQCRLLQSLHTRSYLPQLLRESSLLSLWLFQQQADEWGQLTWYQWQQQVLHQLLCKRGMSLEYLQTALVFHWITFGFDEFSVMTLSP